MLLHGGYEALTMRSVASACGVAVGTMYNYFPGKEMLTASVVLQDWQQARCSMAERAESAPDALSGLEAVAEELTAFWDVYRAIWQQYEKSGHAAPLQGGYHDQLMAQLREIIAPLLKKHGCLHEEALPGFLAQALLSTAREGAGQFRRIVPILKRIL